MKERSESFIGQASSNELRIALHYKDAAEILYNSPAYQDGISLPFLFLVRQFLELGLKYNIKKLSEFSKKKDLITSLNVEHDLQIIHGAFLTHFNGAKNELKISKLKEQKYLAALATLIEKIISLDKNSQGFRYAVDKESKKLIEMDKTFNLKEVFDLLEYSSNVLAHTEDVLNLETTTEQDKA